MDTTHFQVIVSYIDEDVVGCDLVDLTDPSMPDEFAEIYLSAFRPEDVLLLQEGSVLDWWVSNTESKLELRQMPVLTQEDLDRIKAKAKEISEMLGW